ncbi:thioredoxin reductase (NADPH) [Saccharothrix tamanrassetensis]|uniref:Thioredoxin reductase (NADPH) n=1 Tax=Saccharothrix tamanrassetensis TaxID=1051531 RepID=A0A841CDB6_9PSEU|nr:FAD-dependent oxidoreductase [Saccharothrix tamanrassetensis]MBB5954354.1 thioredoxin reductase (NADPH) [Saccharothrix tamanrassetensis]
MPAQPRPTLLAVDDDPHVLRAIRRDLNREYNGQYRVLASQSPSEGLRVLEALRARKEEPALILVDQRMPEMTGIEFLASSLDLFPSARRVLLTAYADTGVAIDAINRVSLDHYLVKPWEPPEELLYPVLNDLLADWRLSYSPPYGGIRIIGHRFTPATHQLRDFLTRMHQPFRFVDVERDASEVDGMELGALPAVLLPDGTRLDKPSHTDLMEVLGLGGETLQPHYDVVIVGGGPAGLAAAVYSASEGLSTILLESYVPGGQAGTSSRIENYLGFPAGVSGAELTRRAVAQVRKFGAEVLSPVSAVSLRSAGRGRVITLSDGSEISGSTVLLATGLAYHRLDAAGAERFEGAGIYYGATSSETTSCTDQHVWIVGGANSAGQAALHFAQHAKSVSMVIRGKGLDAGMSRYLVHEIEHTPNIRVLTETRIVAADGNGRLEQITLEHVTTGALTTEPAEYVFTYIGARPRTDWLDQSVLRDARGFVLTGPDLCLGGTSPLRWEQPREPMLLETSMPGVFAAGDVRSQSIKRIASGVGEGAMAVALIHHYRAVC